MTREQAINLYLKNGRKATTTIARLMAWDETKTITDNTKLAGFSQYPTTIIFARRFGLSYIRKNRKAVLQIDRTLVNALLDKGFTYSRIGLMYGTSRQNIEQAIHTIKKPAKKTQP